MTSIKTVAKKAGVSTATVSRVVNGNYYVSPETKQKVEDTIKELNYYPNMLARSLKNDTTYTIGYVVSDISNDYFTSALKKIENVANERDYNVIVCSTDNKKERELSCLKMLMSKKVDGLIINTTGYNDDFIVEISKNTSVVLIERRITNENFCGDFIGYDNFASMSSLTKHLLSLGHRRIGVINGLMTLVNSKERFEGVVAAAKDYGLPDENIIRYDGDNTVHSGFEAAKHFLGLEHKPTVIIAMNNSMLIGALKYARLHGVAIPEDVSIAVYGNIDNPEILYTMPTCLYCDATVTGSKSVEALLQRIEHRENQTNKEVVLVPQLQISESIRAWVGD